VSYARPFLLSFRARQQRLFDSQVKIVRATGYTDDGDGQAVEFDVVYEGPGQVIKPEAVQRPETIGGEPVEVSAYQATVPHDVDVQGRDVLTVTGSFDPALEGRSFRVVDVRRSEWLVNRRMSLEETSR
jgi:hypothetical protein